MPIAIGVARISGALRCNRWGWGLKDGASTNVSMSSESTLTEFLDDTAAYVKLEREKIIKAFRAKGQSIKSR